MSVEPSKNRPMTRKLLAFAVMLSAVLTLTSCLGDSDDEVIYPSDAAITSFTLGSLKCYTTTTSSKGVDSTYTTTLKGSDYHFMIDQVNRTIYNLDSLPYGTDIAHVLCTILSKSSSSIAIKSMKSDSLFRYSSTDSIDFSSPRQFSVFSLDGKNRIDYTVTLNVRQVKADALYWHNTSTVEAFANAKQMRALAVNGQVFVFTSDGKQGYIFKNNPEDATAWEPVAWDIKRPVPASACQNVVTNGHVLYMLADEDILKSEDGYHWTVTGKIGSRQLLAASSNALYVVGGGGILVSEDEGATWKLDPMDNNASLLPTQDISYCCIPSRINSEVESVVVIGNRSVEDYYDDTQAQIWNKVIERGTYASDNAWMYASTNDVKYYSLPRLSSLSTAAYNGGIVAIGGAGIGACTDAAHARFYFSNDGGIYWSNDKALYLPSGMECNDVVALAADADNYLWLFCGGSGQVWKGRLTSSTSNQQYAITE